VKRRRFLQSLGAAFTPALPALPAATIVASGSLAGFIPAAEAYRTALDSVVWELYPMDCFYFTGPRQLPLFEPERHEWTVDTV
jgi:hypothetical protein